MSMPKHAVACVALLALCMIGSAQAELAMEPIGGISVGSFDEGGSEIITYDKGSKRLFSVNGEKKTLDILDLSDPTGPKLIKSIELKAYGKTANSVAVFNGLVVAAVENKPKQDPGKAVFFDIDGNVLSAVEVGALPDMVTFTPDGSMAVIANEGEPNDEYTRNPEGSISIITIPAEGGKAIKQEHVTTLDFTAFNDKAKIPYSVRGWTKNSTISQDLEPEYVAITADSKTAYVALQENNALAVVDLTAKQIVKIVGLGYKNHSQPGNGMDVSNKDKKINIQPWPVLGMYQPDALATFVVGGETFIISANEGDAREYLVEKENGEEVEGFVEETRVGKLKLDPAMFPNAEALQEKPMLGRLKTTKTDGDIDGDGDHDVIFSYGARSFSIWDAQGNQVYDSGDFIEQYLAKNHAEFFNSTNDENDTFDDRSDDKGPEPEGVVVGTIGGKVYAFVGLERIGGIMAFEVSNPYSPTFAAYVNTREFGGNAKEGKAGDLAPEGLVFIPAADSPNGADLLVVAYEVSSTIRVFKVSAK